MLRSLVNPFTGKFTVDVLYKVYDLTLIIILLAEVWRILPSNHMSRDS